MKNLVLSKCLACGGINLKQVLDFGTQPLANSFVATSQELPTSRLIINFCEDCTHCQLSEAVNPELLYRDYKYVSGTTDTLRRHFADLAGYCKKFFPHKNMNILDIGCNDGSLLDQFAKSGHSVFGVDPATNLRKITEQKGIPVIVDFWDEELSESIKEKYSVICILNCLAHNANPYDFLKGCINVLDEGGIILVEFPYFKNTLILNDLGQFYAEHHSYFSIKSLMALTDRLGLSIVVFLKFPEIHGGTVRFVLKKESHKHLKELSRLADEELIKDKLLQFTKNLDEQISALSEIMSRLHHAGYNIVAYGASAKASTLLNLPKMRGVSQMIKYVVDDNRLKWNLLCPGSNLEIKQPESLLKETEDRLAILMTVHNFKAEIINRLKRFGLTKPRIINYTPKVCVETMNGTVIS